MDGWRVEAWTHPRKGTPTFVTTVDYSELTLQFRPDAVVDSAVHLPANQTDVIDSIIIYDPDTRTASKTALLRAYYMPESGAAPTLPAFEWNAEQLDFEVHDGAVVAKISGPSLRDEANKAAILPYDYPTNPTVKGAWVWNGPSILNNGGFETNAESPETYELFIDATGGTFTITIPDISETTSAITYSADMATAIDVALTALTGVSEVDVQKTGDDTYTLTFITPYLWIDKLDDADIDETSLTGGAGGSTLTITANGGLSPTGWEQATNLVTGELFGQYDVFRLSFAGTEPARTGDHSLKIDGATGYVGAQQRRDVEPGETYRASAWIYTGSSTDKFRVSIRTGDIQDFGTTNVQERWIAASATSTVTPSTWTEFAVEFVVPDDVTWVAFRVSYAGDEATNSTAFYIDDAELRPGLAADNAGNIATLIHTDLASTHSPRERLEWVDLGFDGTNDSGGVAWAEDLTLEAAAWDPFGSGLLDQFQERGYRWDIKPDTETTHELLLWQPGSWGTDYSAADDPAFHIGGVGVDGVLIAMRQPPHTTVIAVGDDGTFLEQTDSDATTAFGAIDGVVDVATTSLTDLGLAADYAELEAAANALSVQVRTGPGGPVPWVDFDTGDTIHFSFGGRVADHDRIVRSWTLKADPTDWSCDIQASRIFTAGAAVKEGLRWLLANQTKRTPRAGAAASTIPPLPTPGSGLPWVVASDDSPAVFQAAAAEVFSSTSDNADTFQAFVDTIRGSGSGTVWFAPGTYRFDWRTGGAAIIDLVNTEFSFVGLGAIAGDTIITIAGDASATNQVAFDRMIGRVDNMHIYDNNGDSNGGTIFRPTGPGMRIENSYVYGSGNTIRCASSLLRIVDSEIGTLAYEAGNAAVQYIGNGGGIWIARSIIVGADRAFLYQNTASGTTTIAAEIWITDSEVSAEDAIKVTADTRQLLDVFITGNTITGLGAGTQTDALVYLENVGARAKLIGNTLGSCNLHGIEMQDCEGVDVLANTILNAGVATDNTWDGIHVAGDSNDNKIIGNTVFTDPALNNTRYGINIADATCDDNIVRGNILTPVANFGSGGLNDNGTGTLTAPDATSGQFE